MDGFTYNNIFETKGIEYLAIILFFTILIPFWILLNKKVKTHKQATVLQNLTLNSLRIPQGLFFNRYHTWAFMEKSGIAKVGLDDLLMRITGEVKLQRVIASGEKIRKGDFLAEIVQDGKLLKVYSPISGEIVETNTSLLSNPVWLNADPYVRGWLYKIKPISWVADTHSCFLAEDATAWSKQELDRFKDFLSESLGKYFAGSSAMVLQDGGELRDQPLSELPNEVWQDFQQDFLSKKVVCKNRKCFRDQLDK